MNDLILTQAKMNQEGKMNQEKLSNHWSSNDAPALYICSFHMNCEPIQE